MTIFTINLKLLLLNKFLKICRLSQSLVAMNRYLILWRKVMTMNKAKAIDFLHIYRTYNIYKCK